LVRAEDFALHYFGKAENGVERRAKLMAHLREKARLRDVRGLGAATRITNSMKVLAPSSIPTGWIRINIQQSPKNRSSMMKRNRQLRTLTSLGDSLRNCRDLATITA